MSHRLAWLLEATGVNLRASGIYVVNLKCPLTTPADNRRHLTKQEKKKLFICSTQCTLTDALAYNRTCSIVLGAVSEMWFICRDRMKVLGSTEYRSGCTA